MTAQERHTQQEPKYRELLRITAQVVENARQVLAKVKKVQARRKGIPLTASLCIDQLRKEITGYCELADRVMDQTRRRVLQGEQVPPEEKVYSIFEPHTDLIKRGKVQKPIEFGHKVVLAESAQGLITDYQVLDGNPSDTHQVPSSLERHQQTFQHSPELYAADRGFWRLALCCSGLSERQDGRASLPRASADNEKACQQAGVAQVCVPQRGGIKTAERDALERSAAFKKGQRFRAGIEGRISVLFRGRGMKRCQSEGRQRFEILVGAAVLANNLMRIAELLRNRKPARRSTAA